MKDFEQIQSRVFRDMSEGIMVIGDDGKIVMTNPRLEEIFEKSSKEMVGRHFAALFFDDEINDEFNQIILDAVYEKGSIQNRQATFHVGETIKYLNVISSSMYEEDNSIAGVIVVISDITELMEVRVKNTVIRTILGKYLSDEVAEEVLNTPGGIDLGGKKENVTILLSDLRGFTALCEKIPATDLMHIVNHYFGVMGKIIKENHGTVIEYVGDGILAVFGAPVPSEKHALDAVTAAVKMQKAMKEINEWNKSSGYPELQMGIGINTGDAVVGNMGSEYTMKYNIIGSSVNSCGRIEGYTVAEQIFISSNTYKEITNNQIELNIDETLRIQAKGVKEELEIYSIYGVGAPLNISYEKSHVEMQDLTIRVKGKIHRLDGKIVSEENMNVEILKESAKQIYIETDMQLERMDNIYIELINGDNKIYGKVLKRENNGYIVQITARQ